MKDLQVREEALRTLYRLRTQLTASEQNSATLLKAVESLIAKYEAAAR